jgi:hypothetical protein
MKMPTHPIYKGCIGYYPLNHVAGKIAFDISKVQCIDGVIAGATFRKSSKGESLYFDGSNSCTVTMTKSTAFNLTTSQITVSAWVRFDALGQERYIAADLNSGATNSMFMLEKLTSNLFRFAWFNGSTVLADGINAAVAGKWYHVVGVRAGSTGAWSAKLYVNGLLEKTTSSATNPSSQASAGTPSIGTPGDYTGGTTFHMNGDIKDVVFWRRALTDTEVRLLYALQKKNY